jgi:hypothetical protein
MMLTSLHTKLAAETHLAGAKVSQVTKKKKPELLKLRGRKLVVSKRDAHHFTPE